MADNPRLEELRRRVQADPASIAFAALAEEFRRVGRFEDAIETCRTGLQRHPAYLSARVTLGRALIETGDYEAAREELETVLTSAPENLAAIRGLAQINERLGHSTEMDPAFAAALRQAAEAPPAIPLSTASAPIRISTFTPTPSPDPEPEPMAVVEAAPEPEPEPAETEPAETEAETELTESAAIARLEQFLSAIQAARHA